MTKEMYDVLSDTYCTDEASKLKTASIIMEESGDAEMAQVLRTLSAQLDFEDNEEASETIAKTKAKLDELIAARQQRNADKYIGVLTDDEILNYSSGEVTKVSDIKARVNGIKSPNAEPFICFFNGSIFDSNIFGGYKGLQYVEDKEHIDLSAFGWNMGHIQLPCHVVLEKDYSTIADLLDISKETVKDIAECNLYVVLDPKNSIYEKGQTLKEDVVNLLNENITISTGCDALYILLKDLNFADKPERLAFSVLPVISIKFRPIAGLLKEGEPKESASVCSESDFNGYYNKILLCCELFNINKAEQLKLKSVIQTLVNALVKFASSCKFNINKKYSLLEEQQYISHLEILLRQRNFGNEPIKEETVQTEIDFSQYPKNIKIIKGYTLSDFSFKELVSECVYILKYFERANNMLEKHKLSKAAQEDLNRRKTVLDNLKKLYNTILTCAYNEKENLTVIWVSLIDFYSPLTTDEVTEILSGNPFKDSDADTDDISDDNLNNDFFDNDPFGNPFGNHFDDSIPVKEFEEIDTSHKSSPFTKAAYNQSCMEVEPFAFEFDLPLTVKAILFPHSDDFFGKDSIL